jgi:hypothetical protein
MVFTIVAELASTGSVSTGVFQMLSAGSTGQPPIICCAEAGAAIMSASAAARTFARIMSGGSGNRRAAGPPPFSGPSPGPPLVRPLTNLAPAVQF